MTSAWIVLGLAGFLATIMLVKLMQRRQRQLIELLRDYSNSQLEWSRKKARAALLARRAALQKREEAELRGTAEGQDLKTAP